MATLPMPSLSKQWPDQSPEQPSAQALRLPRAVRAPQPAAPRPSLSALEWSVVAMAESDGISSLREPSRFVSALHSLFGVQRPNRLANDRLEALRRLAVYAWRYRWNVPDSELRQFLDAGFTLDQYQLVQTSIAKARTSRATQRRRFS